ncbi:MAG TPA: hypothetical protein VMP03_13470, partial [Methylomirabilota bacterium]|nr:hypothetical protein [Methylomirabilota bacterium]
LVYSLDREAAGASTLSSSLPLIELAPSSGNVTQSIYLISSLILLFTCTVVFVAAPFSETILLRSAATAHLTFGVIDMFSSIGAVELFFEYIRTGDYAMLIGQEITGFRRLIGAAPEASAFGGLSVGMFAYFLSAWTETRSRTNFVFAALLLAFTIMSLSSTAYVALAFTICFWVAMAGLARARIFNVGGSIMVSLVTVMLVAAAFVLINSEFYNTVESVLNNLVFDKLESQSGVERGDWARQSVQNFIDTGGLGVGLGSSRPNGWPTAVLGQLGVVGAVLWGIFLLMTILRPLPNGMSPSTKIARQSISPARAGALTVLFGASLSSPQVDPGYFFMTYVAAILAHRALLKAEIKFVQSRPLHPAGMGRT